ADSHGSEVSDSGCQSRIAWAYSVAVEAFRKSTTRSASGASSMKTRIQRNGVAAKRVTVKGKRMVMLEEADFDRLMYKADEWEPLMPEPDADGNYPALEALRVSLARKIIRDRRRLGLTQADL